MAWIESHQQLAKHPKVLRLARTLRITKAQAIGHLHLFWWWTLDYAPTGDLSAFASHEIGSAAEWTGDADRFAQALRESGWLDGNSVHDWHEYAGKLVVQREKDRDRKRQSRASASSGIPPDVGQTAVAQYRTVPNRGESEKTRARARRLHGIPDTPEEVVAYGATLNPKVSEQRCRNFFAHYEGQKRTNPSGDVFWITRGDTVVTDWQAKLPSFGGDEQHGSHRQNSGEGTDRNAKTANAGKSGQYAGLGKMGGIPTEGQ